MHDTQTWKINRRNLCYAAIADRAQHQTVDALLTKTAIALMQVQPFW
ncbi:MAG: hypothetical protein KME45_31430 [Stenomitos rutilans HA7619-LM2]|nr:hypothetical protein [Stenomitos rutilans HA7619-LM2]